MTTSVFGNLFDGNDIRPSDHPANVVIDFAQPAGTAWRMAYNMANPIDIATINRNLADGYRIIGLSVATAADLDEIFAG